MSFGWQIQENTIKIDTAKHTKYAIYPCMDNPLSLSDDIVYYYMTITQANNNNYYA